MFARHCVLSLIAMGFFLALAHAGDQPSSKAQAQQAQAAAAQTAAAQAAEAKQRQELAKRLKDVAQAAAGGAADKQIEEARRQIASVQKRLADAKKTLADSQKETDESQEAVAAEQRRLDEAQDRFTKAERQRVDAGLKTDKRSDEARQQVAEARKRLVEAKKTLADVQKELDESKLAVAEEERRVADAQRRLAELQRRAAQRTRVAFNPGFAVPQTVDRTNPIERFLLLTPSGPLVVEATITIDGQSFHEPREKLVDEMLKLATDKDGKPTWAQAILNSRRFAGQVQYFANDDQRQQYLDAMDVNHDGLVDRYEARRMLAQRAGGGDFLLNAGYGYGFSGGGVAVVQQGQMYNPNGGSDLRALLDTNGDGILSAQEIAAAPERLKSRDADDNDVLDATELNIAPTGRRAATAAAARPVQAQPAHPLAVMLGAAVSGTDLLAVLKQTYGGKEGEITSKSFPALKKLFDEFDVNHDGKWSADEVLAFDRLPPHVRLKIAFGEKGQGLAVEAVAAELEKPTASGLSTGTLVTLPGVKLTFGANNAAMRTYDYSSYAKQLIATYDKNANGYIEKDEMPAGLAQQFAMWDENDDGKVYAEEIVASYNRQLAPRMSQVAATVSIQGNALFAALDANGDGRLGLREMRLAAERIRSFDKNNDGQVTPDEVPVSMTVGFGLGGYAYGYQYGGMGQRPTGSSGAPEWFLRMDRNGDGDISPREFLGTPEQFKKLDVNGDGLIDRAEAEAAGGSPPRK